MSKFVSVHLIMIALWLVGTLSAFYFLDKYKATAGPRVTLEKWWPTLSKLDFAHKTKNLVIFVHPKCQCSEATLHELNNLVMSTGKTIKIHALFYRPLNSEVSWNHTVLWDKALIIPGVVVHDDIDGHEAKLFGVETSGHTALFDETGRLTFSGGITASRGHIGMSDGQKMLQLLISDRAAPLAETPTYGCSFFKKDSNLNNLTLFANEGDINGLKR